MNAKSMQVLVSQFNANTNKALHSDSMQFWCIGHVQPIVLHLTKFFDTSLCIHWNFLGSQTRKFLVIPSVPCINRILWRANPEIFCDAPLHFTIFFGKYNYQKIS